MIWDQPWLSACGADIRALNWICNEVSFIASCLVTVQLSYIHLLTQIKEWNSVSVVNSQHKMVVAEETCRFVKMYGKLDDYFTLMEM